MTTTRPAARPNIPDQEQLVETWLDRHPGSTVVAIWDGIESEHGIRIDRIQARIERITKGRSCIASAQITAAMPASSEARP